MYVAIAGNIGAGKSSLATLLSKHYGWEVYPESAENNPYLKDFYMDMERWAFQVQMHFLGVRFKQALEISRVTHSLVQDRTIYEDAYIFARNLHSSGLMSERDFTTYLQFFRSIVELVKPPDLLIYLQADLPKLVTQIRKRGRGYEKRISLEYLSSLNAYYESWISTYDEGPILTIDVNDLDYISREEDFIDITKQIDRLLFKLHP
jgi:deoxyadenosine/deoxycytidine kinase